MRSHVCSRIGWGYNARLFLMSSSTAYGFLFYVVTTDMALVVGMNFVEFLVRDFGSGFAKWRAVCGMAWHGYLEWRGAHRLV